MRDLIAQRILPYLFRSKPVVALLCSIGALMVSYGMLAKNNLVFIIGLVCIVGGYLLVRQRLKKYIRNSH